MAATDKRSLGRVFSQFSSSPSPVEDALFTSSCLHKGHFASEYRSAARAASMELNKYWVDSLFFNEHC